MRHFMENKKKFFSLGILTILSCLSLSASENGEKLVANQNSNNNNYNNSNNNNNKGNNNKGNNNNNKGNNGNSSGNNSVYGDDSMMMNDSCSGLSADEQNFASQLNDSNAMMFCSQMTPAQRQKAMQMNGTRGPSGTKMSPDDSVQYAMKNSAPNAGKGQRGSGACPVQ